jgi:hypothetical protein
LTRELVPEMAGALAQIRESLAPAVYLEELEHLLAKQQNRNRSLVASLLAALPEDFLVPLAAKVPQSDDPAVSSFASLYKKVATQVRALAPESPLGRRLHAEQQVLDGVFRDISRRNEADKQQKIAVVEKRYDELRKARKDEAKKHPDVAELRHSAIRFAVLGTLGFSITVSWLLGFFGPLGEFIRPLIYLLDLFAAIFVLAVPLWLGLEIGKDVGSRLVQKIGHGLIGKLAGFLVGFQVGALTSITLLVPVLAWAAFVEIGRAFSRLPQGEDTFVVMFVAAAGVQMHCLALFDFYKYRRTVASAGLTAAESNAYQTSLENIEDHFRQKEELEQAQATVAAAKAQPLSRGLVMQELGLA